MKAKLKDINPHQPAIDAFTLDMMRHFNKLPPPLSPPKSSSPWSSWFASPGPKQANAVAAERVQPLVYATYQAYLRR